MTTNPQRTVHILGAGALGHLWASHLYKLGHEVVFLEREGNTTGSRRFRYSPATGGDKAAVDRQSFTVQVRASNPVSEHQPLDILLVTTKSQHALSAIQSIAHLFTSNSATVLLCNGLGYQQDIADYLWQSHGAALWSGVSSDGALLQSRELLEHTGAGQTYVGLYQPRPGASKVSGQLMRTLGVDVEDALLKVLPCDSVQEKIHEKFFINCAINALTVIHRCSNGELISRPQAHRDFSALCAELQEVRDALASSSPKTFDVYSEASAVALRTSLNRSSMLRDYERGRALEITWLNAYLAELAHEYGIETPLHDQILEKLGQHIC